MPASRSRVLAMLLVLLTALLGLGWIYFRASLPRVSGEISVSGLAAPVSIVRDRDGVPHIYAESDADAGFALGFAHAQDRLWQLEMNRRIGAGRLSEVFGETTLETDQFLRTLGLHRAARSATQHLSPETMELLVAYAAGVNAWLDSGRGLPPEFTILGVTPEPWTVVDSLAWMKMMSWDLSNDWDLELLRLRLVQAVGESRAAELLPSVPEDTATILDALQLPAEQADAMLALDDRLRDDYRLRGLDVGSNSWVVSGAATASGLPILANDPHLGARIPSIWYLAEMHGDRLHVSGATLPGVPGVILGRNQRIAWGLTNLNPDVQDLYVERIDSADANRYRSGDAWLPMTVVEELIGVKGRDAPIPWAARATRHGPLLSDVVDAPVPVALRWTALDPDDTSLDALLSINYAESWQDIRAAMRRFITPSQNFVYADVDGHIGYFGPGRIPIRAGGDGKLPAPGWDDAFEWKAFIPFEELPQVLDPPAGFVVTANNRVVGDDYPHHLGSDWAPPYRAARITEALQDLIAKGGIRAEDISALQADQLSLQATEMLPLLRRLDPVDERQAVALKLLADWDGTMQREGAAPAIYQAWLKALAEVILSDDLSGELLESMLKRRHPVFLAQILSAPDATSPWCDDVLSPEREGCDEAALLALDAALDDLELRLGTKPEAWRWGDLHRTQYDHNPFSEVGLLRRLFHRSIANGGDPYTVNVANIDLSAAYDQANVPSYRQVVDMGSAQAGHYMQSTGQSGHPLSPHYDDLIERHRDVEYLEMRLSAEMAEGDRLTLKPADGSDR